jgi:hypothetical protein
MSASNNLEGPPPTPEERAAMARELRRVAPTPGDRFRLMFGQRPTPRTDASRVFVNMTPDPNATPAEFVDAATCEALERELAEAREEGEEQARLLGMSGEREAGLLAEVDRLKRELAEAREEIDEWFAVFQFASKCAGDMRKQRDRLAACLDHLREKDWFREGVTGREVVCGLDPDKVREALAALKGGTNDA